MKEIIPYIKSLNDKDEISSNSKNEQIYRIIDIKESLYKKEFGIYSHCKNEYSERIPWLRKLNTLREIDFDTMLTIPELKEGYGVLERDSEQPKSYFDSVPSDIEPSLEYLRRIWLYRYKYTMYGKEFNFHAQVNMWLKTVINNLYLKYCDKNGIPMPKNLISIPEHLIWETITAETEEQFFRKIDMVVGKYVGEDAVYPTPYGKEIKKSKEKLVDAVYDGTISGLLEINKPMEQFRFDNIHYADLSIEQERRIYLHLKLAEEFINAFIPRKYWGKFARNIQVFVDDVRCRKRESYSQYGNYMLLKSDSLPSTIVHELIHCLHRDNFGMTEIAGDFIGEHTKSQTPKKLKKSNPFSDYRDDEVYIPTNRIKLEDYATKRYKTTLGYDESTELFTVYVSMMLNTFDILAGYLTNEDLKNVIWKQENLNHALDSNKKNKEKYFISLHESGLKIMGLDSTINGTMSEEELIAKLREVMVKNVRSSFSAFCRGYIKENSDLDFPAVLLGFFNGQYASAL